jgi:hypothetical protein
MIEDIIWGGIVSYNSSKLGYDAVVLEDREEDRELIVVTIARNSLKSKESLLFLLLV